jgi:hypothetical protein
MSKARYEREGSEKREREGVEVDAVDVGSE